MPRTKRDQTNTTSVVEQNEKTTEVEQTENATTENNSVVDNEKPAETKPVEEKPAEDKPINDDDKIVIKCKAYAGMSIVLPTRTISLDENGCCEVTGIEAKRLLTIPGYERA